jgi:hypothetical protein
MLKPGFGFDGGVLILTVMRLFCGQLFNRI